MKAVSGFRISLALIIVFLVLMLTFSVFMARVYQLPAASPLPDPQRLAAIVRLFESLPDADRPIALTSFSSRLLSVSFKDQYTNIRTMTEGRTADTTARLEGYERALAGRLVSISFDRGDANTSVMPALLDTVTLQVDLKTGGALVFAAFLPVRTVWRIPFVLLAGLLGALIALAMFIFLQNQIRPLRDLSRALENHDYGRTADEIPERLATAPEIRALIRTFNQQQARLAWAEQARSSLITGLQHDIRTFATKLRLRLERSSDTSLRDRATSDLEDIVRLLDDALLATQGEVLADKRPDEMVGLKDLIASEIAARPTDTVTLKQGDKSDLKELHVLGDRLSLRRIVSNLIDNALVYGGHAAIEILGTETEVIIHIDDDGPGIPEDKRNLVLEPFVRLEKSRSRATGGFGLGLAIVAKLVAQQEGQLLISDAPTPLNGARVSVTLPRFDPRK